MMGETNLASILVVDDSKETNEILCMVLELEGHRPTGAVSGAQAIELLNTQSFDLILLDLMMPEVDGLDVLASMGEQSELTATPVIVITASVDQSLHRRALEQGAQEIMLKPLDTPDLIRKIDALTRKPKG